MLAVNRDTERVADLTHARVGEAAETIGQGGERDALDRVEIHGGAPRNGIHVRFENDLAGQPPDGGGARCDQGSS